MRKIHSRPRLMLYAVSGMGINMLNLMMGSYLCSALLVGGFGEAAIPFQTFAQRDLILPAVWAVFALVAKIIDGVIDIPMAAFTDKLRTRWGRRRPAILMGLIPTIVTFLLFLVIPNPAGATLGNTVYYGVVLCLFYSAYTLTMVTYYATFTEIVDTTEERNLISNVKSVCDIVYFILGYVVVRMLLNGLNVRVVSLIVLPLSMTMLIPLFMIREDSTLDGVAAGSAETVSLVKSLSFTLRNRPFIIWMLVYSFMNFGVQLFLGGINEYFSFVNMSMIYIMVAAFAPVPLTLILYNKLIAKRGFGFAYRCVLVIFIAGMCAMGIAGLLPASTFKTVFGILTGLVSSFAVGAVFSVGYSIPAELAAQEEKRTGVSNAAMYFAVQGLFAGIASGIATGVVLTALKGSETHPTSAIKYMTFVAAAGCAVALALSWLLPKALMQLGKKNGDTK